MSDEELMEDWVECTLDDVLIRISNGTSAKQFKEEVGFPVSRIETIWNEKIDLNRVKYIKENSKELIFKYGLKKNDILISHINSDLHLGKTAIFKSETNVLIHGINLLLLRPSSKIIAEYLLFKLRFLKVRGTFLDIASRSVNQSSVNQHKLKKISLLLAPLPIQRAIVSKIETLFSDLDNGIADLKKAQDQLKIYRQAVLKKAFEKAFEINEKIISDVVLKIQIGPFGSQLHKEDYIENGIPLINPMHIQDGKIQPNLSYSITKNKRDSLPNYIIESGDVVMGRRGEMGRCGLVSDKEAGWFCGTGSLYFRPIRETTYPLYLYYYMRSAIVKELLTGSATGTTMMNLNKKIVSNLPIPLPALQEQHQIVREIESRLSVCDKVEECIKQSLEKAQALRQSILKKAFEGKLLSSAEIEKCKAEADYEPASVLLERIRAERAAG